MPSAHGEIAIGLRCGCCICKWQHCDSSLSLHRPRHPTQKAIRDKERIDRDNTRSQSKHAREMLSAQTVWISWAQRLEREIVRWCWGRESEILSDVTGLQEMAACVWFLWIHIFVGFVCGFVASQRWPNRGQNEACVKQWCLQGSFYEKSHFAWSFEIKEFIVLGKHTVTFRTQNFLPDPKRASIEN